MDNVVGDYHNAEIQMLLNQYVTREKYGSYTDILHEIIHRRAFEFGFSVSRMEKEIQSMAENIASISFSSELEDNTAAEYSLVDKKILINEKFFNEIMKDYSTFLEPKTVNYVVGEMFFSALNHEVYHAITRIDDKSTGLEYLEPYGMS